MSIFFTNHIYCQIKHVLFPLHACSNKKELLVISQSWVLQSTVSLSSTHLGSTFMRALVLDFAPLSHGLEQSLQSDHSVYLQSVEEKV